jgi:para-aminobenzoate synthetase/4-amino-4-deoxychorismate lyase
MGIIAALEDSPRGVYCGTIGYLAPPSAPGPRASFNVAIRTVVRTPPPGRPSTGRAGDHGTRGERRYDETVAKARCSPRAVPPSVC